MIIRNSKGQFIKGQIPHNKKEKIKLICQNCKKEFYVIPSRKITKFCSSKCYGKTLKGQHLSLKTEFKKGHKVQKGKNNSNWKGGKYKSRKGYWYIYKPEHPFTIWNSYVLQSRLVAEKYLGRYLTKKEIIHHLGEKYPMNSSKNKLDDRPENLYLFKNAGKHIGYHHLKIKPELKSNLKLANQSQ